MSKEIINHDGKVGLHFRYSEGITESEVVKRLVEYSFDSQRPVTAHDEAAPNGKVYLLKCLCGSNHWSDNGRFINEYECSCCGQFVEVRFTNHGKNGEGQ